MRNVKSKIKKFNFLEGFGYLKNIFMVYIRFMYRISFVSSFRFCTGTFTVLLSVAIGVLSATIWQFELCPALFL